VKDSPKTLKELRREKEKELIKNKQKIPYPSLDELRKENEEVSPFLLFNIKVKDGTAVRNLTKPVSKGINRVTWDLRYAMPAPLKLDKPDFDPLKQSSKGFLALPGEYYVDVLRYIRGSIDTLILDKKFKIESLNNTVLPSASTVELADYYKEVLDTYKKTVKAQSELSELLVKIKNIKQQVVRTPGLDVKLFKKIEAIESKLLDIDWKFKGQKPPASPEERWAQPVPLNDRFYFLVYSHLNTTYKVTKAEKDALKILNDRIPDILNDIMDIKEIKLHEIRRDLMNSGAGWIPDNSKN